MQKYSEEAVAVEQENCYLQKTYYNRFLKHASLRYSIPRHLNCHGTFTALKTNRAVSVPDGSGIAIQNQIYQRLVRRDEFLQSHEILQSHMALIVLKDVWLHDECCPCLSNTCCVCKSPFNRDFETL